MASPARDERALAGLCAVFARRRAEALVASLAGAAALDEHGLAWAADVADALERLMAHAGGETGPAAAAAGALAAARDGAAADGPEGTADRLRALAADVLAAVPPADPAAAGPVPLSLLVLAARADARRAAEARGVPVAVDIVVPEAIELAPGVAEALVDVLGRVLRDSVVHGTPEGGAIRVVAHLERDDLVLVASDRTGDRPGDDRTPLRPERLAGLRAAGGRLASAGGELSVGSGPWGGASITLRVPAGDAGTRAPRRRRG
jgi:hypothetical protein